MKKFRKIFFLLNRRERKSGFFLLLLILLVSIFDTIGIASILPFIAILADPDIIDNNDVINIIFQVFKNFNLETKDEFLYFFGYFVFFIFITSISLKSLTIYFQTRYVQLIEYNLSKGLFEKYLSQTYLWFLSRNSSEIGKNILAEVNSVVANGVNALMTLISSGILIILIITLLTILNPMLALIILTTLGASYLIIFISFQKYIKKIGLKRLNSNQLRFSLINEAFSATKEVKIGSLENRYIEKFSQSASIFAKTQASFTIVSLLPRFLLEAIAFGGILLIILYLKHQNNQFNLIIPIVSLYAFAGYRLFPALQEFYRSLIQINFSNATLNNLVDDFKNLKFLKRNYNINNIHFQKSIDLNNISFKYPSSKQRILKDISLNIPSKSIIGIIGKSGSGKTTTVDVILGLLEPKSGTLEIDGKIITRDNVQSWQNLIGYVPQQIYLRDDTISANIAFECDYEDINHDLVEKVSKIANLHNFIINELPEKYNTEIGERGVRISGGQRQRIGIARALYKMPKLLVFDEATSALDYKTEKIIFESINNLKKKVTIIIIAHRLNNLKDCDKIYKLENGQIVKKGTYENVIGNNQY